MTKLHRFEAQDCVEIVERIKRDNAAFGTNAAPCPHEKLYADHHGKEIEFLGRASGSNGTAFDYCAVRFPGEKQIRTVQPFRMGF